MTDSRFRALQRQYILTGDDNDLDLLLQEHFRTGAPVNFDATSDCVEIQRVLNRPIAESLQFTFAGIYPREIVRAVYTSAEGDTARLDLLYPEYSATPDLPSSSTATFHLRALGILLADLSMESSVWACVWQAQEQGYLHCRGMLIHRQPNKYSVIAMTQLLEGSHNVDAALTIHRLTEQATEELTGFVNRDFNRPIKSKFAEPLNLGYPIVSVEICWLPAWLY